MDSKEGVLQLEDCSTIEGLANAYVIRPGEKTGKLVFVIKRSTVEHHFIEENGLDV